MQVCYTFCMYNSGSRIAAWSIVMAWMAAIFALSSVPDLRSGFQPLWDLVLRKFAHAAEYAILGWLLQRAFRQHAMSGTRASVLSIVVTAAYAISDEFHQTFVQGRRGALLDVITDSAGGLVGALLPLRRR